MVNAQNQIVQLSKYTSPGHSIVFFIIVRWQSSLIYPLFQKRKKLSKALESFSAFVLLGKQLKKY